MFTVDKNAVPTPDIIKSAIEYNEKEEPLFNVLENYYNGRHPILDRKKIAKILKDNKIIVNHAEYITDLNTGYLLGDPVSYTTEDLTNVEALDPIIQEYREQDISDLDHEIGTDASVFGCSYEYVYSDEESNPRSAKIDPRNCVIVYDKSVAHKKLFAIMYGEKARIGSNYGWEDVVVVDNNRIYNYSEDLKTVTSTDDHAFLQVPLVKYRNNARSRSDFYSVTTLIDAYNTLQSDRVNDKEQAVEAILILFGFRLTEDQKSDVKLNKTLFAPPKIEGTAAEYLQKTMQEADVDILRQKLSEDIHKISKTPNFSDESFAGNVSGVAMKFKLMCFDQNIKNKKRYYVKSLKERFKLYTNFLKIRSSILEIEMYNLRIVFNEALPQNDLETSQTLSNVSELIDDETALSQLSFIDNPKEVMEKKKIERAEAVTLMQSQFPADAPVTDESAN